MAQGCGFAERGVTNRAKFFGGLYCSDKRGSVDGVEGAPTSLAAFVSKLVPEGVCDTCCVLVPALCERGVKPERVLLAALDPRVAWRLVDALAVPHNPHLHLTRVALGCSMCYIAL